LGEGGGENERSDGLPFRPYAEAGSVLERAIKRSGAAREQFRIFNTINCQPPGNKLEGEAYEVEAIECCRVHRERVIEQMRPRAILALGNVALRALTGAAGKYRSIAYMRGYVLDSEYTHVLPSFHPSFIRRGNSHLLGVLIHDIQKAVALAAGQVNGFVLHPEFEALEGYIRNPTIDDARLFVRRVAESPQALLTYDIEHPKSHESEDERDDSATAPITDPSETIIQSIQLSLEPGGGVYLPWYGEYVDLAKQMLEGPNPKAGHNVWKSDNPRLRRNGVNVAGRVDDTMWMWSKLQPDLPRNLQFVASFYGMPFPWKHLRDELPEVYGIADVDAPQRIMQRILGDLAARGVVRSYTEHTFKLETVLTSAADRGVPINDAERCKLRVVLDMEKGQLKAQLQTLVPEELRSVRPKEGYKREPKNTAGMIKRRFLEDAKTGLLDAKPSYVERWCWLLPFNPGSWQQLLAYMRFKRHRVPVRRGGGETTAKAELERLARSTNDPLYKLLIEYREVEKILSTYVDGWAPESDGRVHTTFSHAPATGQLASADPNIQNAPRKVALAKAFRRIVEARSGHRLVEFDYKSFHALTLGFEARDADYMRLARLDIHSYLASHLVKQPADLGVSDADLKGYLVEIRARYPDLRNNRAKGAMLGYGFGMGWRKLYETNREMFDSPVQARNVMETIDELFPAEKIYRDQVRESAHKRGFLLSRHGYMRYFWDVYHWDAKRGQMIPGDDSEAAIAFLPANDAFGHIKDVMLRLEERGWNERFGLINQIHDELMFETPDSLVDEAIPAIAAEMEKPSLILIDPLVAPGGLSCGVGVKIGRNWAEMEEIDVVAS
jgi:uracil-DNA glycosylase family 4